MDWPPVQIFVRVENFIISIKNLKTELEQCSMRTAIGLWTRLLIGAI
jgi:hypothetical protein